MTLLFVLLVLLGFGAMIGAHWPRNAPWTEFPAWLLWGLAALIWALPRLSGAA